MFAYALIAVSGAATVNSPAQANPRYAALVVDAKSGKTLFERNADAPRYPASLTKMMTLYIVFEELTAGRLTLDSPLKVSAYAAARPPSKLGVRPGQTIRVEDAIKALAVKSANDVSVVIAENIGDSVEAFAQRMTRTARALGMSGTTFTNPNGLPDANQKTTARDMARLGQALHDRFPRYFPYFGTQTFRYGKAAYRNTNRLLGAVSGVEGIKTGYTQASGFNLVTSVKRGNRHIIAVVMGGQTGASRNAHMRELIAEYLPDASPDRRTAPMLVAEVSAITPVSLPRVRPVSAHQPISIAQLPSSEPIMLKQGPVVTAALGPAPRPQGPAEDPIAARIFAAEEVAQLAYAPSDGPAYDPIARLAELAQSKAGAVRHAGKPVRRSGTAGGGSSLGRDGWTIQIGAVPSEAGANELLEKARASAVEIIGDHNPFTQQVTKNGVTLYRARFAGFSGKDEARAACATLAKRSFDCLALPN